MRLRKAVLGLAVFATAAFLASTATRAQQGSPLTALGGNWSGNGNISFSDGHKERIRCRAEYKPNSGGSQINIGLTCASDSYKFELSADAEYQGGSISGRWSERTRGAAGSLSGRASPGQISVNAVGQTFAAILNISTHGNSQNVRIEAPGSTVSQVAITMARR
jgi:hypothetical protein